MWDKTLEFATICVEHRASRNFITPGRKALSEGTHVEMLRPVRLSARSQHSSESSPAKSLPGSPCPCRVCLPARNSLPY